MAKIEEESAVSAPERKEGPWKYEFTRWRILRRIFRTMVMQVLMPLPIALFLLSSKDGTAIAIGAGTVLVVLLTLLMMRAKIEPIYRKGLCPKCKIPRRGRGIWEWQDGQWVPTLAELNCTKCNETETKSLEDL